MTFNIYNIIILAGIVQGFIFSFLVFTIKKFNSTSTFLLSCLVLSYSLGNLQYILPDIGLMSLYSMYLYVYLPFAALIPVLIYMYVYHFLHPLEKITRFEKLLLVPFLFFLLLTIAFRILFILNINTAFWFKKFVYIVRFIEIFSVLLSIVLLIKIITKVHSYRKENTKFNHSVIRSRLTWLANTLIAILIGTLLWAYLTYRNIFVPESNVSFYSLWIAIAIMIYWLGHVGIYKFGIIEQRKRIREYQAENKGPFIESKSKNNYIIAFQKLLLDEKLFLDPRLTLHTISERLQISPSHLSRIIKKELNTNYSSYINSLRVSEAKRYLTNPEFSRYTITAIGLEAGFNSKSAFYDIFKKATGQTPLSYKRNSI